MISVSTTVPGGGLVRFTASPVLWNSLALILFFTMITENLGLKRNITLEFSLEELRITESNF